MIKAYDKHQPGHITKPRFWICIDWDLEQDLTAFLSVLYFLEQPGLIWSTVVQMNSLENALQISEACSVLKRNGP